MTTQSTTAPPAATAMFPSTELANWQHRITAKPIATTPKNAQSAMTATSWNPKDANAQKTETAQQPAPRQTIRSQPSLLTPHLNPALTVQPLVTKSHLATKDITFLLTKNPAPKTTPAEEILTPHAQLPNIQP